MVIVRHIYGDLMEFGILGIFQDLIYDPGTFRSMRLHLLEFFRSKTSRLPEYGVVNGNLSQIVHRRGFDYVCAERRRKNRVFFFQHLFNQNTHALTGPLDVTACGVVAAFNHGGHADDQSVMHLDQVRGLFLHFAFQFGREFIQEIDILDIQRIVGNEELISATASAVIKEVHIDLIDIFASLASIVERVAFRVLLKSSDPLSGSAVQERRGVDRLIDRKFFYQREILLGGLIGSQITEFEVKGNKTGLALFDK